MNKDKDVGESLSAVTGRILREKLEILISPLAFIGAVVGALPCLFHGRGMRWREFRYYFYMCGVQSLPVVALISLLLGVVMGLQSAEILVKFGADDWEVNLVAYSFVKEFGPLIVAMVAIGRAGCAFAAEIGTMKVNEEISALSTLGIRPEAYLVLPKLAAMVVLMPLLVIFSDIFGIIGGMAVGVSYLHLAPLAYIQRTLDCVGVEKFIYGMAKGIPFGILITMSGCYCGFEASGDAQGVGRGATKSVVLSIFLIAIADAVIVFM